MDFCPKCGQENHVKRASIRILTTDFLQDYWTFDSKLFRSIIPLIAKPGYITTEFISGRRQKYIPPIRFYLFVSFIFFFTLSIILNIKQSNKQDVENTAPNIAYSDTTNNLIADTNIIIITHYKTDSSVLSTSISKTYYPYRAEKKETKNWLTKLGEDMQKAEEGLTVEEIDEYDELFNEIDKKTTLISDKKSDYSKRFYKATITNFSILLFILIPFLAFLFYLFYYRKKNYYVDSLIFTLHYQSFIFLILWFQIILFQFIQIPYIFSLTLLWIIIYGIWSAKNVFNVKIISSILRFSGISFVYLLIGIITFIIMLATTVITT